MHRILRFVAVLLLGTAFHASALAANGYRTLDEARASEQSDRIEVIEFFWYGCPHCYRFEPHISRWSENRPSDVSFRHVPAVFSPTWELHGRAFYAAEVLDVLDRFHRPMFEALHEEGRELDSEAAIGEFVSTLDIDGDEFVGAMQSFAVDTKIRRARGLQERYGISGTPSVVIDGRYVTSGSMAGSLERVIEVIDDRITAIRAGSD